MSAPLLIASQIVTGAAGALLTAALAALTLGLARAQGFKHQTGRNEAFSHAGNMISAVGAGTVAHLFGAPWMLAVMGAMTFGALLAVRTIRAADIDHEAARGDEPQDPPPAPRATDARPAHAFRPCHGGRRNAAARKSTSFRVFIGRCLRVA